jgi:glucose/arabinose dehydrogenase
MRRSVTAAVVVVIAGTAVVAGANVRGWRALVMARLFRVDNHPIVATPPSGFRPRVPPGFRAEIVATRFNTPRWLAFAPNGDLFVAESGAGRLLRLTFSADGSRVASTDVFADGLTQPFGIAFLDEFVYVANTNELVRYHYDPATSARLGSAEHVLDLPGFGYRQHWTRSVAVDRRGHRLFVSVGSASNVSVESDVRRGAILAVSPDGRGARVYANGLRNAVGLALNPTDDRLWATVNERDNLADDVPNDFFTHIADGGFYGWPFSYLGAHRDDRVPGRPDSVGRAIVPDVLLGAHVAPLQFAFYQDAQFPPRYREGAFIAEHGSWNRKIRSGYDVVFVPFQNGNPSGPPESFLSGFVPDPGQKIVYGRPVGVAVAPDGSLFISDDGCDVIWRVSFPKGNE